ncbi:hypothetical protein BHE74_00057226 [Ensete ventricosum]|nr:hypothetical protein BHE74_00057226 [Ensete ventricosum]
MYGFMKKCDGHKLCVKSRIDSSFDRFFVHRLGNSKYWLFPTYLAHGKSYEHGFTKKYDSHKLFVELRVESSFDHFFVYIWKFKILAILRKEREVWQNF